MNTKPPVFKCPECGCSGRQTTIGLCIPCTKRRIKHQNRLDRNTDAAQKKLDAIAVERDRLEIARENEKKRLALEIKQSEEAEEKAFAANEAAVIELAERERCRRNFLPFVYRFESDYDAGWVHADICRRLEQFERDVLDGKSPRLILTMPPRHGKSALVSKTFPAWFLGRNPTKEIISCSYNQALAMDFSRKVRGIMQDDDFMNIFPAAPLDPKSQSAERWNTDIGGGYVSAGVSTGITGRGCHCFPAGTMVSTPTGNVDISLLRDGDSITTCNILNGQVVVSKVRGKNERNSTRLIGIRTVSGKFIRVTPDHRFFIPTVGWVEAQYLQTGDSLTLLNGFLPLQLVQKDDCSLASRSEESVPQGACNTDLLYGVQSQEPTQHLFEKMPYLWGSIPSYSVKGGEILQPEMPTSPQGVGGQGMSDLQQSISTQEPPYSVLQLGLCLRGAFRTDDGQEQPQLQRRAQLLQVVSPYETTDSRPRSWVRHLPKYETVSDTPYRPYTSEQRGGESNSAVQCLPPEPPPLLRDTISAIEVISGESHTVYDIGVEEHHCFFAEEILVHNCGLIDDPIKDRDSAESETVRESVKNWYSSTFYTRLAPGAGIVIVQTRWHEDDLAGWLIKTFEEAKADAEKNGEAIPDDVDQWEVINYPAIAVEDETYRKKGEALHEARYPLSALAKIKRTLIPRDWEALYMQRPTSDDGEYFTRNMLRYYDTMPLVEDMKIYAAWDLAISTSEHADYTCGFVIGVDKSDNVYVLDRVYGRFTALQILDNMFAIQKKWRPEIVGIESGQIELTLEPFLIKRQLEERLTIPYRKLKTRGKDKATRARTVQGRMEQGRVFLPKSALWTQDLVNELLKFPLGLHDDQVDALAWVFNMLILFSTVRDVKAAKKKSWRDKLKKYTGLNSTSKRTSMGA